MKKLDKEREKSQIPFFGLKIRIGLIPFTITRGCILYGISRLHLSFNDVFFALVRLSPSPNGTLFEQRYLVVSGFAMVMELHDTYLQSEKIIVLNWDLKKRFQNQITLFLNYFENEANSFQTTSHWNLQIIVQKNPRDMPNQGNLDGVCIEVQVR